MSAGNEVSRGRAQMHAVFVSLGLLGALFLIGPPDVQGAKSFFSQCMDTAFADYNECLMESSSWFSQKLCDFSWEFDAAYCTAAAIGDVKKGYEEGSGTR
jgi:hypothetical protein